MRGYRSTPKSAGRPQLSILRLGIFLLIFAVLFGEWVTVSKNQSSNDSP
jgi:hypothetical protein